jgi:hypothetical protein
MNRLPITIATMVVFAFLMRPTDALAGLTVVQTNSGVPYTGPQLWSRDETAPGSNVWLVTLNPHPTETTTTYQIDDSGSSGAVIANLLINRPNSTGRIVVNIGTTSVAARPAEVTLIRTSDTFSNGLVLVIANIHDTLGEVRFVNDLNATLGRPTLGGDVGGDVVGPITCLYQEGGEISIQSLGDGGDLTGDVIMRSNTDAGFASGTITLLDFRYGVIGAENAKVNIRADQFIERVRGEEIHANITGTNAVPDDGDPMTDPFGLFDSFVEGIGLVETARKGTGSGLFTGEIRAVKFGRPGSSSNDDPKLLFRGQMKGRIWLQRVDENLGDNLAEIRMKWNADESLRGLKGTISMRVPAQTGTVADVWDGPVSLYENFDLLTGSRIVLTADDGGPSGYSPPRIAASLGGGAAGVAPFYPHLNDSFPLHQQEFIGTDARPSPSNPIKRRFYGPVNWDRTGAPPFVIQRRRLSDGAGQTDETCGFEQTIEGEELSFTPGTVVLLTPTAPLPRGYEYIITRATRGDGSNVLRCALPHLSITAAPEVVDFEPMTFTICDSDALGDADDSGVVNFADVTNVLATFGLSGCPLSPPEYETYVIDGDADRDGDRDFADVNEVLANYNLTWCTALGQSIASKGEGPINHMDFEADEPMSASEAAGVVTSALASMGYASIEAFSEAIAAMDEESRNAEVRRLGQLLEGAE